MIFKRAADRSLGSTNDYLNFPRQSGSVGLMNKNT